jgi:hypothetical protein
MMMQFLVLLTPHAHTSGEAFKPYLVPEQVHVWASYRQGHLREFYFQQEPTVITMIYELPDLDGLHAELDKLPMIEAGLLDRQVVHLGAWAPLEVIFDKTLIAT